MFAHNQDQGTERALKRSSLWLSGQQTDFFHSPGERNDSKEKDQGLLLGFPVGDCNKRLKLSGPEMVMDFDGSKRKFPFLCFNSGESDEGVCHQNKRPRTDCNRTMTIKLKGKVKQLVRLHPDVTVDHFKKMISSTFGLELANFNLLCGTQVLVDGMRTLRQYGITAGKLVWVVPTLYQRIYPSSGRRKRCDNPGVALGGGGSHSAGNSLPQPPSLPLPKPEEQAFLVFSDDGDGAASHVDSLTSSRKRIHDHRMGIVGEQEEGLLPAASKRQQFFSATNQF